MTRSHAATIVVGMIVTALLVVTARVPEAGAGWRLAFVGVHLAGSAASAWYVWRRPLGAGTVLVGALAFRLCALPMLPTLSDDGYRYLWDGWLTAQADVSPYAYRPSDPALARGHDRAEYRRMNSRGYYSVYPPASQIAFAAAVWAAPGSDWRSAWWTWKLLMVAAELSAVALLLRVVRPAAVALYAWSPLAVVEVAGQGHTEALVLLGLAATLAASGRRWPLASLGLSLAGAVKLYPFALLPVAWRRDGWRGVAATVGVVGGSVLLFASPGALGHVSESIGLFFGTFDEYAAPYRLLKAGLYPLLGEGAGRGSSLLLGAAFTVVAALAVLTDDGSAEQKRWAVAVVTCAFALTTSTLHPWYWLPVLFVSPLLDCKNPALWITAVASGSYLSYTVPGIDLMVLVIGWGGAFILWWTSRRTATAGRPGAQTPPSPSPRRSRERSDSGGTT